MHLITFKRKAIQSNSIKSSTVYFSLHTYHRVDSQGHWQHLPPIVPGVATAPSVTPGVATVPAVSPGATATPTSAPGSTTV